MIHLIYIGFLTLTLCNKGSSHRTNIDENVKNLHTDGYHDWKYDFEKYRESGWDSNFDPLKLIIIIYPESDGARMFSYFSEGSGPNGYYSRGIFGFDGSHPFCIDFIHSIIRYM